MNSQVDKFNITVQNIVQKGTNKLEFDVYLLYTDPGQVFELASCQLGFLINSLIYTGGALSAKIDNTDSGLQPYQQFKSEPVVESKLSGYPDQTLIKLSKTPDITKQGTFISTVAPGTLLTHFILTSTVDFTVNSTPDLIFISSSALSPLFPTKVIEYIYSNTYKYKRQLTVTPGENALVYGNPVLNPMDLPKVFEVTGTGSYCQGGDGRPVGLTGSETGVKYILYKDEIAQNPVIEGTGFEITFGNQLYGKYNVTGTNKAGITKMKGDAVITENPNPAPPVKDTIIQPTCTLSTGSVILRGLPAEGTWILFRSPDQVITSGSGTSTTVEGLSAGTYSFTVTDASGCTSGSSDEVVINSQPPVPDIPAITVDCSLGAKKAIVTVTSPLGNGFEYRLDDGIFQSETSFPGVANGIHTVTVRNSYGCTTTGPPFEVACDCLNPPTITLGSISGSTCGTAIITVSDNKFSGSVTRVTITGNGAGNIIPASTSTTPFDFIYQPASADIGKIITITLTTDNPEGSPCVAASATFTLTVNAVPSAPVIGSVTQPTCTISTGSVILYGLPSSGVWTVTGIPGPVTRTGEGTSATISDLLANTYTFTVTNADGCTSQPSASVDIDPQPPIPAPPVVGTITPPTCTVSTGSVLLSGLPLTGNWILTRHPGTFITTGTGTNAIISGLTAGTYIFTVTNSSGCTSSLSEDVIIPAQPLTPAPPGIGGITQPTLTVPTGSVTLTGLPSSGTWSLTMNPGNVIITGTGSSVTIEGLGPGTYLFTVTNSDGCTSSATTVVIDPQPKPPTVIVNNPPTICSTLTADLTLPEITAGSDANLTFTYWYNEEATMPFPTPDKAPAGTYYIKGTSSGGYFTIKPVVVIADQMPVADAGPDIMLGYEFETKLEAKVPEYGNGMWSVIKGEGKISDVYNPNATVKELSMGENILSWKVINGVCPPAQDSLVITVKDFTIPSLLTPNMDGKNDYFIIIGIESLGKTELVVFDRRGSKVFWSNNYNNDWNGVDYKGNLLPDDTYFYIVKSESGKSLSGFVVLRK